MYQYYYPNSYPGSYQEFYPSTPKYYQTNKSGGQDERFVGGFALPFLLGGAAGLAVAPAFMRPYYYPPAPAYYYPPAAPNYYYPRPCPYC